MIEETYPPVGIAPYDSTIDTSNEYELLSYAWAIIANAGQGNWERESDEWQGAASQWRTQYFRWLDERS